VLLVAELDRRDLELALALDVGLLGAVDHDVGNSRVVEQLLERTETEQLVDEHLFKRKLFAAVERELELGEHFADDRPEFLGELVLVERCGGFGVDPFEQAREHLFLDLVDAGLETFDLWAGFVLGGLAVVQACHRVGDDRGRSIVQRAGERGRFYGRELRAAVERGRRRWRRAAGTLHRARDAESRPGRARAADSAAFSESAHYLPRINGLPPQHTVAGQGE
jgi:hypothetical protein